MYVVYSLVRYLNYVVVEGTNSGLNLASSLRPTLHPCGTPRGAKAWGTLPGGRNNSVLRREKQIHNFTQSRLYFKLRLITRSYSIIDVNFKNLYREGTEKKGPD